MSSKYRHEIIMDWTEEDQAFIAEVSELPGCAAAGASYLEILANLERVLTNGSRRRELGRTIPEPKGRLMYA